MQGKCISLSILFFFQASQIYSFFYQIVQWSELIYFKYEEIGNSWELSNLYLFMVKMEHILL